MGNVVQDNAAKLENAADALVDAASFHTIVSWLHSNGFEDAIHDSETPLDAVLHLLEDYKSHLGFADIVRKAIEKV